MESSEEIYWLNGSTEAEESVPPSKRNAQRIDAGISNDWWGFNETKTVTTHEALLGIGFSCRSANGLTCALDWKLNGGWVLNLRWSSSIKWTQPPKGVKGVFKKMTWIIQVTMLLSTEGSFFTERAIEWKGDGRTTWFANILQDLLNNLILKSI